MIIIIMYNFQYLNISKIQGLLYLIGENLQIMEVSKTL